MINLNRISIKRLFQRIRRRFISPKKVEINGYTLFIFEDSSNFYYKLSNGDIYEPKETEMVKKIVKKGDIVVDVGAHVGYFTILFGKIVGNRGRVYAIEPDLDNYNLLLKNIKENKLNNIVPIFGCISEREEVVNLWKSSDYTVDHRIYKEGNRKGQNTFSFTLDCLFQYLPKIDFMKMDIQGAELSALMGGGNTFKKTKTGLIEYSVNSNCVKVLNGWGFKNMKISKDTCFFWKEQNLNEKEKNKVMSE